MKLKYQGGVTRLLCCKRAQWYKQQFKKELMHSGLPAINNSKPLDWEVISLSGCGGFEDQVLSIYSFLYYAGRPYKWTVYSDGTYTAEQKQLLSINFDFVVVKDWNCFPEYKRSKSIGAYLQVCALAKKINIVIGHSFERRTIYLDSDIVFYSNISQYLQAPVLTKGLWYASDVLSLADSFLQLHPGALYPLNSGFLIFDHGFEKADVIDYMESLNGNFDYFSEQSSFAYAFIKQKAQVLDPRQFVNDTGDQFDFAMKYKANQIAMRHYTSPIRHKMWQNGWRWHFKG